MKRIIITLVCSLIGGGGTMFGQWTPIQATKREDGKNTSLVRDYYKLDINKIREQLSNAQETGPNKKPVELSLPVLSGKIEKFAVYSFPVVAKSLADQYQLGSYVGIGIDDPSKYVRFSVSPTDFQSMILKDGVYEFIEPKDTAKTTYGVHAGTEYSAGKSFVCSTKEGYKEVHQVDQMYMHGKSFTNQPTDFAKISDKKYRTFRLAISASGEYTSFHGGTVAGAMSAINATMTRVNGVFEKDFAAHLNLQDYQNLIYTDAATDPYSIGGSNGVWSLELQNMLTANLGNNKYDIGHLFNAENGYQQGFAGGVGFICIDPSSIQPFGKGSAFTQSNNPVGHSFDMTVAHEMGHQLGATHTYSYSIDGRPDLNIEPGAGSTIMSYADATINQYPEVQVQEQKDAYFHIGNIKQVHATLIEKTCNMEAPITNNPPKISPLSTYTIPKGTAFALTASVIDTENDPMTYTWEQVDIAQIGIIKTNLGTTTSGASFRSVAPSASPIRYFPKLSSVLNGVLDNSNNGWESVSMVPRTSKFALTVRDNNPDPTQQQTQYAEQTIIVGNEGPFKINTLYGASNAPSTIEWDVANTAEDPYNVANVKIDYTTDNGSTWNVLSEFTPNDGTENITFPPSLDEQSIKLRISAKDNVFYAVKTILITTFSSCNGSAPVNIAASNLTATSANIYWQPVVNASLYKIRYKKVSETVWQEMNSNTSYITLNSLADGTDYEIQVAAVCLGNPGSYSKSSTFKTLGIPYCTSGSSVIPDNTGYISNVTISNINNNSIQTQYEDYTTNPDLQINLIKEKFYPLSVTISDLPADFNYALRAYIDFNKNGIFEDSEKVFNYPAGLFSGTLISTVSVPSTAVENQILRMRVILHSTIGFSEENSCGPFLLGEVEDYNVMLTSNNLSISELERKNESIQLYPNPVSDILHFTKISDKAVYKIYSATGQLLSNGNITNDQVDVSKLIKGKYIIKIKEKDKKSSNFKFLKK